jgi:hypothetical protein
MEASCADNLPAVTSNPEELHLVDRDSVALDDSHEPEQNEGAEVINIPVDPDALVKGVLELLGFKGRTLEDKLDKLTPSERYQLVNRFGDDVIKKQGQ